MTKKHSPAFPCYAENFFTDVITWSNEEVGCYLRLLLIEWTNGHLPFDAKKLRKICQISEKKWPKIWNQIATKLQVDEKDCIYNERLELERDKQIKYSE